MKHAILFIAIFGLMWPVFSFAQSQMELNDMAWQRAKEKEALCEQLLQKEFINTEPTVIEALRRENSAWRRYHRQLNRTFRILVENPSGLEASSLEMCVGEILEDDAHIREISLRKTGETYSAISEERVVQEYNTFKATQQDNDYQYPVTVRQRALDSEMQLWQKWMRCRDEVSAMLQGFRKKAYDNATNTVRRMKLIMLMNCYESYGPISNDINELLLSYDAPDDSLALPSFNERWLERYGSL